MGKRTAKIALLALLLLVMGASFGTMYTNAKYTSTVNGHVSAQVAKYVFNVNAKDSYKTNDTIQNITLAQTCNESTLVNGKIAPGTSGSFDIELNAEGSDVAIKYEIDFTNKIGKALPKNLVIKLDGQAWDFSKIEDTISANAENKKVTHTITWKWEYETTGGDVQDTTDGQNAFDYLYDITVTGTQVRPA